MQPSSQQHVLLELVRAVMPFGKYKGRKIIDLPEPYLVWYHQKGFPKGKLGEQLGLIYEIKANGLEYLLTPIRKMHPGR
ncbi:DUF3820 family protein [Nafulsella turpanensis]|uniref:DUF3820 family protein n=1 Tax=Nafulsella turpanensis TaxID=1265690 RepID=UPI00058F4DAD|nr:DUF3820 family protein [Nafulsella turpanensis]